MKSILVLNDIRSAQNVGSLFRTADACGIDTICLSSITPSPIDRFGRVNTSVTKASLGAEKSIKWETFSDLQELIANLKKDGYRVVAIEQSENSIDYKSFKAEKNMAFILGNEVYGLPKDILEICNLIVEIPMNGKKESLNVAVAGGIALFRILNI